MSDRYCVHCSKCISHRGQSAKYCDNVCHDAYWTQHRPIRGGYRASEKGIDDARKRNRKYYYTTRAKQYAADPVKYLHDVAKKRAKKFGIEFDLQPEDIIVYTECPITLEPLSIKTSNARTGMSLDRINTSKGYIKGNVAVISRKGNMLKNNATLQEVSRILKYMEKHGC